MELPNDLRTPRDLFGKLKREADRFRLDPNADHLFNFMVTAWHLQEWVQNGPAKNSSAIETDQKALCATDCIQMCRDIANASKHFVLRSTYKNRTVDKVSRIGPALDPGAFQSDAFQTKRSYSIRVGTKAHDAGQVIDDVLGLYEAFFAKHNL